MLQKNIRLSLLKKQIGKELNIILVNGTAMVGKVLDVDQDSILVTIVGDDLAIIPDRSILYYSINSLKKTG